MLAHPARRHAQLPIGSVRSAAPLDARALGKMAHPRAVAACTERGERPSQEDRCAVVPLARGATFIGVWDGTVGPHASEFALKVFQPTLSANPVRTPLAPRPSRAPYMRAHRERGGARGARGVSCPGARGFISAGAGTRAIVRNRP